jgi:hypothetical protein
VAVKSSLRKAGNGSPSRGRQRPRSAPGARAAYTRDGSDKKREKEDPPLGTTAKGKAALDDALYSVRKKAQEFSDTVPAEEADGFIVAALQRIEEKEREKETLISSTLGKASRNAWHDNFITFDQTQLGGSGSLPKEVQVTPHQTLYPGIPMHQLLAITAHSVASNMQKDRDVDIQHIMASSGISTDLGVDLEALGLFSSSAPGGSTSTSSVVIPKSERNASRVFFASQCLASQELRSQLDTVTMQPGVAKSTRALGSLVEEYGASLAENLADRIWKSKVVPLVLPSFVSSSFRPSFLHSSFLPSFISFLHFLPCFTSFLPSLPYLFRRVSSWMCW